MYCMRAVNNIVIMLSIVIIILAVALLVAIVTITSNPAKTFTVTHTKTLTKTLVKTRTLTRNRTLIVTKTITLTNTTPPIQGDLEIQEAVFYKKISSDGTKMTITLFMSFKNACNKQVIIKKIKVPDANWSTTLNIVLNPGETYSGSWTILENISYTTAWESGQGHDVIIEYQISGTSEIRDAVIRVVVF